MSVSLALAFGGSILGTRNVARLRAKWRERRAYFDVGLAGSAALHMAGALIVLLLLSSREELVVIVPARMMDMVELDETGAFSGEGGDVAVSTTAAPSAPLVQTPEAFKGPSAAPPKPEDVTELLRRAEAAHRLEVKSRGPEIASQGHVATIGAGSGFGDTPGANPLKDFIRAQIERRWQFRRSSDALQDMVILIRIVVHSDGSVSRAEIVSDPRHAGNPEYDEAARSARNAALLSSPLQLPRGMGSDAMELVVDFNVRDALR